MIRRPKTVHLVSEAPNSGWSVVVILGAAVWPGGRASNAIRRRVRGALASAQDLGHTKFIPSGAVGRNPPSEAKVMAALLSENGVADHQIILDEHSVNTLASVRNCSEIINSLKGVSTVVVCSDVYHVPRCRWLFYLCGIRTVPGKVVDGRSENKLSRWVYYYAREFAAVPWDTIVLLASTLRPRK
jgi:uncharacterized SAM-binding protein YcdF (DUF218 family)